MSDPSNCSVEAMISSFLQLLILFICQYADAMCTGSSEIALKVSVTNSTHLNVALPSAVSRNCHIKKTEMMIQKNADNRTVTVEWPSKDIAIETDICMRHVIELKVTFTDIKTEEEVQEKWSSPAYYNADHKVENLYSGLLKEKVFEKICEKTNGDHFIPSLPNEVKRCIIAKSLKIESESKEWKFEILNPLGQGRTPITGRLERLEKCNITSQPSQSVGQLDQDQPILAVIIGTSLLFLVFAVVIYWKWFKNKKKEVRGADVNPMYEGAADYEYDEVVNNDMTTTTTRREVKAEVVDRSSIYGEEEEGWENVVVLDQNPYYEC